MDVTGDDGVDLPPGEYRGRTLPEAGRPSVLVALVVAPAAGLGGERRDPPAERTRQDAEPHDRERIPEDAAQQPIAALRTPQRVAVAEVEPAAVVLVEVGVVEDLYPELALEPAGPLAAAHPVVVVSAHQADPDAAVGRAAERPEDGVEARRRRRAVLEPEVEEVAQDVDRLAGRARVEERDQRALLGSLARGRLPAEVGVGEEIDGKGHRAAT